MQQCLKDIVTPQHYILFYAVFTERLIIFERRDMKYTNVHDRGFRSLFTFINGQQCDYIKENEMGWIHRMQERERDDKNHVISRRF